MALARFGKRAVEVDRIRQSSGDPMLETRSVFGEMDGSRSVAVAVAALIFTLREWNSVGLLRTVSRSLVLFTFILEFAASWLFFARGFGVEIDACRLTEGQETCRGQASPQEVLGMLAWQAADVVPVLQVTESFGWDRPARSESPVVGAAVVIISLWLAIWVLAIVKRIWDGWGQHLRRRVRPKSRRTLCRRDPSFILRCKFAREKWRMVSFRRLTLYVEVRGKVEAVGHSARRTESSSPP